MSPELEGSDSDIILVDIYYRKVKIFTIALQKEKTTEELVQLLKNIIREEYEIKTETLKF